MLEDRSKDQRDEQHILRDGEIRDINRKYRCGFIEWCREKQD